MRCDRQCDLLAEQFLALCHWRDFLVTQDE